jgi:hypothetical protein
MAITRYIDAQADLSVSTGSAYTADTIIGGLLRFDVPSAAAGGLIAGALLVDAANQQAACTLYLFNAEPTTLADGAEPDFTTADARKLVAALDFSSYQTVNDGTNNRAYALLSDVNRVFGTSGGALWGYLVTSGTPTFSAAADLSVRLTVLSG